VNDGAPVNKCSVGGAPVAEKVAAIMGVSAGESVPMRAFLKCKGTKEASPRKLTYDGIKDCRSAATIPGGSPNACPFGCIGLGSCVSVCKFNALSMGDDGLPKVNVNNCVACGACVAICPKGIFTLVPKAADVIVACNSHWKGAQVRPVCTAGCIGCGICAKVCPVQAVEVVNDLAVIDQSKCIKCGKCAERCPAKCIKTGEKAVA
ncbi:MAG: 4Fe-4S binding protein, partial [Synergistaceae bacterium]|nr:4Fe-4S binding protein [Synergistaceae bacterium]